MKLNEISLEIIQKCPNNCLHCSSYSNANSSHILDYDVFVRTIDNAVELGMSRLCLSGGEPFEHPMIIDMVRYAKLNGVEVFIYTSGLVTNQDNQIISISSDKLKKLKALEVDKLIFNVEAAVESIYDEVMGTSNCFEKMKKSIIDSKSFDIYSEIHFVPMKINMSQIVPVFEMAKDLKVDKISFLRLVLQGRAKHNSDRVALTDQEYESVNYILRGLEGNGEIDIRRGIPLSSKEEGKKCNAGTSKLIIRYDGAVFPCEAFKYIYALNNGSFISPDNINVTPLKEIYKNSAFLKSLRGEIIDFNLNNGSCEMCPAQWRINKKLIL